MSAGLIDLICLRRFSSGDSLADGTKGCVGDKLSCDAMALVPVAGVDGGSLRFALSNSIG